MTDIDVDRILSQLTLDEKVALTAGKDFWHTVPIPRLGIPSIRTSDGPNGVRGTRFFNSNPAACLPCGTALGATFDCDLLQQAGSLLGQECRARGVHVLLGPTINIQRAPTGGRGFESFSEDPHLSGVLAGFYCEGVQSEDIIATPKHFVCNDQEDHRMGVDTIVTQRALREVYLMPFMLAIHKAKPTAIMTAYNKVNGIHCSEHRQLMESILRQEWEWEGLLMSDWFGTYSTSESINAGLDLEMPGPTLWRGRLLSHAVINNKVKQHDLDQSVRKVLTLVKAAAKSGIAEGAEEGQLDRSSDRSLLRRLASESIVLLKNEGHILPLTKTKPVAVIGPNCKYAAYAGGGSAHLLPYYSVSPFEGVSSKCPQVRYSLGAHTHKSLPLLDSRIRTKDGKPGFTFQVWDRPSGSEDRRLLDELNQTRSDMFIADYVVPNWTSHRYFIDVQGVFTPEDDGLYDFGLTVQGTGQLFIDDELIVDNTRNQRRGTAFFGAGTIEEIGSIELQKGSHHRLRVEFGTPDDATQQMGTGGLRIGCCKRIDPEKAIQDAAQLASEVEQVVCFVGLNSDWESESFDRPDMNLPGRSDELIAAVLAANPNTVIVNQSGTPVTMPWADEAKAIVQAWYGGNETGNGIADVLFGDVNPSGKLPLSFPRRLSDNPAFLNWGSEKGRVLYGEDVYVGYRYYDKVSRPALFPFGHGLSYTNFELSGLTVAATATHINVWLQIENCGAVAGAEVIQVYIAPVSPSINRPVKELKGFRKVTLEAGANTHVTISMELKYATSFWDEERAAWAVEKGKYKVMVGSSSCAQYRTGEFAVRDTWWWNGL